MNRSPVESRDPLFKRIVVRELGLGILPEPLNLDVLCVSVVNTY